MVLNFQKEICITRVGNAVAAGTTTVLSSVIDMTLAPTFDGVLFLVLFNAATNGSVITLTPYQNIANATGGTATAITGGVVTVTAGVSGYSNNYLVSEIIRPSKRYLYVSIGITTQNLAIDGIVAFQYTSHANPIIQPAALLAAALAGPLQ
jgi:hypothetical protein